jgi:hypothetical protein
VLAPFCLSKKTGVELWMGGLAGQRMRQNTRKAALLCARIPLERGAGQAL